MGEGVEAVEEMIKRFGGGLGVAFGPEFGHAVGAELEAFGIAGFVEAVGGEQDRISGGELDDVLVVGGDGEEAGGESAFAQRLAGGGGGVKREGESRVGKSQGACGRVKDSIERGTKAAVERTLQQTLVQKREDGAGVDAGLVNAAESAHDESAVHGGGESLADHVAEVETDEAVGQAEEIDEVAAHFEEGSEAESDFDPRVTQRGGREERRLDETSFAHVIVADAATVESFSFRV